ALLQQLLLSLVFCRWSLDQLLVHSFPTRRSSDLDYDSTTETFGLTNYVMRTASGYRTDLQYFTMDNESEYVPDIFYGRFPVRTRSEEHTSELQSRENLVYRLLLEKKNDSIGSTVY